MQRARSKNQGDDDRHREKRRHQGEERRMVRLFNWSPRRSVSHQL
jgi:hypothetical protein